MDGLGKGILGGVLFEAKSWMRYLLPTKYFAVYYPTPDAIIGRMLKLADVSQKDMLYDLGCGDGRVLVAAATKHGARGVGIELDAELAAAAVANAKRNQVEHLVKIVRGDASKADVSDATVLALYLSDKGNKQLVQALRPTLKPGTRIVSFFFQIEGWDRQLVKVDSQENLSVYLYKAPDHSP